MIARIAIDSDALTDHREASRQTNHIHRDLVQVLESFGFVEFSGTSDVNALFDAIASLNPDMRELWIDALDGLSELNRMHRGTQDAPTRDLCTTVPISEVLGTAVDLVVVREQLASQRESLHSSGHEHRPGEPEVSLADSVRHCLTIDQLRSLREVANFPTDTPRSTIVDDVLAAPARVSTEATLLDRYFLKHLLNDWPREKRDHAEWLIEVLGRTMAEGSTVRLLCEWPAYKSGKRIPVRTLRERVERRIAPIVADGRLSRAELILASWPWKFEDRPHNRHLRFGSGFAITTEEGFDTLDKDVLDGLEGFTWHAVASGSTLGHLRERENVIEGQPDGLTIRL